jgi:hypothetical protein
MLYILATLDRPLSDSTISFNFAGRLLTTIEEGREREGEASHVRRKRKQILLLGLRVVVFRR